MGRFLQSEFVRKAREAWRWLRGLQIPVHAAHAGFFLILSLFPTLVLLLTGVPALRASGATA